MDVFSLFCSYYVGKLEKEIRTIHAGNKTIGHLFIAFLSRLGRALLPKLDSQPFSNQGAEVYSVKENVPLSVGLKIIHRSQGSLE